MLYNDIHKRKMLQLAQCLDCGSRSIRLTHCSSMPFNYGGGICLHCGRTMFAPIGRNPASGQLETIWNAGNDIDLLIQAEHVAILKASLNIAVLKERQEEATVELQADEKGPLLVPAEVFMEGDHQGLGVWATATHRSNIATSVARPQWATHVALYAG